MIFEYPRGTVGDEYPQGELQPSAVLRGCLNRAFRTPGGAERPFTEATARRGRGPVNDVPW